MNNIFTDHPHAMGETYLEHCYFALRFGCKLIIAGFACITHAIFPFIFKSTGSDLVIKMTHDFVERMPQLEDRILCIQECIEKKKNSHGRCD